MGIPEGTLSSRLARAKILLRRRLTRRGLALTATLLSSHPVREAQADVVSGVLVQSTIRAATLVSAGLSVTGLVTVSVQSLMGEVLNAMLFAKLKGIGFALVAVGAVVTGAIVLGQESVPRREEPQPRAVDPVPTKTADPTAGLPARGGVATAETPEGFTRRPDPDRLGALEHKLDRILEALGSPRANAEGGVSSPAGAQRWAVTERATGSARVYSYPAGAKRQHSWRRVPTG